VLAHLRNLPSAFQRLELHLQLAFAGLAGLVVFALILSLLPKPALDEQLLEDYGAILAEQLAGLTVESIVKQDRIALNVLAERIAKTEAVAGVAVFSVDGQRLAGYGEFAEHQAFTFTESVLIDGAYAGFARVVLKGGRIQSPRSHHRRKPCYLHNTWHLDRLAYPYAPTGLQKHSGWPTTQRTYAPCAFRFGIEFTIRGTLIDRQPVQPAGSDERPTRRYSRRLRTDH